MAQPHLRIITRRNLANANHGAGYILDHDGIVQYIRSIISWLECTAIPSMQRISLLAFAAVLALPINADFDFANYPICAQQILYNVAPLSCDHGSIADAEGEMTDACLCIDEGFLQDSAQQIFQQCGCADLTTSATVNSDNCAKYQTNSALSELQYIEAGSATCNSAGGGLDAGSIVGIVFGIVGFLALVVGLMQLFTAWGWIPKWAAPWPKIKKAVKWCFCGCCG